MAQPLNRLLEERVANAVHIVERQQVMALLRQARDTGEAMDRALVRLHEGRYGRCERCGGPIAAERLAGRPSPPTCFTCAG